MKRARFPSGEPAFFVTNKAQDGVFRLKIDNPYPRWEVRLPKADNGINKAVDGETHIPGGKSAKSKLTTV